MTTVKRVEQPRGEPAHPEDCRKRPAECDIDREQDATGISEDLTSAEERRRDTYRVD
jgi:hypothetical protein